MFVFLCRCFERLKYTVISYFFRPGGLYSIAICRIALFYYLYIHVFRGILENGIGDLDYYSKVNIAAYHAKSLLYLLFPQSPPPVEILHWAVLIAGVATVFAAIGFLTRLSMIVSVFTLIFLASLVYAWEPLWSHPYNSGLIAGLGFMFGRAGDALSVDSLIARHVFRRPIRTERAIYWWPVILGLFGTSTVYFGGFYAKWSTTEWTYTLSWALSDNLRNSASLPWLIYGREFPWQVDLLVNHPLLWKTAALGHLASQALPMMALFSLNRPYLRLAEGVVFVIGVAGLKAVMGFWNPEWMILAAFFVDWDYFLSKAGVAVQKSHKVPIINAGPIAWSAAFMLANLVVIAVRYDDRGSSRLFPLSSMSFYSNVAALRPYNEHRHYPFAYGDLIITRKDGSRIEWNCYPARAKQAALGFSNNLSAEEKLSIQAGEIAAARRLVSAAGDISDCNGIKSTSDYTVIEQYTSLLVIPPYPAPVRFEVGHRALLGRYEKDGDRFLVAAGRVRSDGGRRLVDVASSGLDVNHFDVLIANDPWKNYRPGSLIQLDGVWNGLTFTVDAEQKLPAGWYPVVVRVTEKSGARYDFFGGVMYRY